MYPGAHAETDPDKPALVMHGSGATVTYGELEDRSRQGAQRLRRLGLRPGDHVALGVENHPRFLEICWAAQRAGLYYTAISTRLTPDEVAYIVDDCRVDEEGYLYLTDRKAHMIISGGVNVYPQEAENVRVTHPRVQDVAVIGVPNEEFGEEVKALVQPLDMAEAGEELARELLAYCRARLSHVKCPRSVDFEAELPRHPTGKLYKRLLRDRYWTGHASRIV